MTIRCHAQRLLNPFRGAAHTIRFQAAEAVTTDGRHWDVYVAMDDLLDGLQGVRRVQVSDIRYGSWSPDKGLKRGPLYPSEDFRRMEEMGAVVYEHLTRHHREVPFAFADRHELWLLDCAGAPLALLDSVVDEEDIPPDQAVEWRAGIAARERFGSAALASIREAAGGSAADYLARYVNARAGETPRAQWFRREPDGSGVGLRGIGACARFEGRRLAGEAFPALLLAQAGHDEAHRRLIEDFQGWQAPWLLMLPLDAAIRGRLEGQARAQALAVHDLHRLYPAMADPQLVRAALVEAVLRRSQPQREARREEQLSTFYIELSPGGAE
jgi:hypothetical protein